MPGSYRSCSRGASALVVGVHVVADAHFLRDREAAVVLLDVDARGGSGFAAFATLAALADAGEPRLRRRAEHAAERERQQRAADD